MAVRLGESREEHIDLENQPTGVKFTKHSLLTELINSVRVYNIPLVNFIINGILGYFLLKLTTRYNDLYMKSSLVTITISNLVLYGISETLAQSIMAYRHGGRMISFYVNPRFANFFRRRSNSIELEDDTEQEEHRTSLDSNNEEIYNEFLSYIENDETPPRTPPRTSLGTEHARGFPLVSTFFLFSRLAGFMCWGFIMSFFQCWWYKFLQIYAKDPKIVEVIRKVLTDQLCYSPVSLFAFFTYGTMVLENGSWEDSKRKLSRVYLKTLLVNYSVWFPVQFINFLIVPRSYQVPFSSSISVLWNCFLSMRNSSS